MSSGKPILCFFFIVLQTGQMPTIYDSWSTFISLTENTEKIQKKNMSYIFNAKAFWLGRPIRQRKALNLKICDI